MKHAIKIQELHPELEIIKQEGKYYFVKDKYGICKVETHSLLYGSKPTISTAIDKTEYFQNKLKEVSPELKVVSPYLGAFGRIQVQNKYGICSCIANNLLSGMKPGLKVAIDFQSYYINMLKEKHNNKYDYSLTKFKNVRDKVKIICNEHGIFEQTVNRHLVGFGCKNCMFKKRREKTGSIVHDLKKEFAVNYKGGKCIKCGYNKNLAAFDFHHRNPEEKLFNIAKSHGKSTKELIVELDKCDLLCANCHREHHSELIKIKNK